MKKLTNRGKRQQGLSTVGLITVIGLFGVIVVTLFKVFPMYYDNYKLKSTLESMQTDNSLDTKSKRAIWESLNKRLYINEVKSIRPEHVTMVRKDGKTTVTVMYEVRDSYLSNLFIGAYFNESVVIDR